MLNDLFVSFLLFFVFELCRQGSMTGDIDSLTHWGRWIITITQCGLQSRETSWTLLRTALLVMTQMGLLFSICLFFLQEMIRSSLRTSGLCVLIVAFEGGTVPQRQVTEVTQLDWILWRVGFWTAMAKAAAPASRSLCAPQCSESLQRGRPWRVWSRGATWSDSCLKGTLWLLCRKSSEVGEGRAKVTVRRLR